MNFANYSKLNLTILVMDENIHNATFLKQSLFYFSNVSLMLKLVYDIGT